MTAKKGGEGWRERDNGAMGAAVVMEEEHWWCWRVTVLGGGDGGTACWERNMCGMMT